MYDIRTLTDHVEKNLFLRRIPARMFVVLGPLLLVLASIGIYAVVAYTVSHRTTEIGVRLALGATAERVVVQIVGESLRVIAARRDGRMADCVRRQPSPRARTGFLVGVCGRAGGSARPGGGGVLDARQKRGRAGSARRAAGALRAVSTIRSSCFLSYSGFFLYTAAAFAQPWCYDVRRIIPAGGEMQAGK